MDLFVVPTVSFRLLYGLLILQHDRRQMLWLGVTAPPTAEWISHQLTEAYGWKVAPRYIIRDRDAVYGDVFIHRGRWAFGIDQPRRDRRGRTDIAKGRSVRSGGNVLTTLSCSARGIFAICCDLTRPTTTRLARTCQSTRARRCREQYMPLVAFWLRQFSADFIICMCEFDFRQTQSGRGSTGWRKRQEYLERRYQYRRRTDSRPRDTHKFPSRPQREFGFPRHRSEPGRAQDAGSFALGQRRQAEKRRGNLACKPRPLPQVRSSSGRGEESGQHV
jgi:hypothetical protein